MCNSTNSRGGRSAASEPEPPRTAQPPDLAEAERLYGTPATWRFRIPMAPREFHILDTTGTDGRWQDATILIRSEAGRRAFTLDEPIIVIAKHWYPDGIYRCPSGGVRPGEAVLDTARREAWEETGLHVRLTRYVLATDGVFYQGPSDRPERTHAWRSHIFLAEPTHGTLGPQDVREIREARIRHARDLTESFHPRLLATGIGGFRYRVGLEERSLGALGLPVAGRVAGDGDTDRAVAGYQL